VDLEHRFKTQQIEVEEQQRQQQQQQQAAGRLPDSGEYYYSSQVIPTGRLEQLPPQSVVDELYV
jgi:hypothetical protein